MSNPDSNNQCPTCNGKRRVGYPDRPQPLYNCPTCNGTGVIQTGRDFAKEAEEIKKLHKEHDYQCSWCGAKPVEGETDIRVTRFEVIDHREDGEGRVFVARPVRVQLMYQDDGKTLKVRITDRGER